MYPIFRSSSAQPRKYKYNQQLNKKVYEKLTERFMESKVLDITKRKRNNNLLTTNIKKMGNYD